MPLDCVAMGFGMRIVSSMFAVWICGYRSVDSLSQHTGHPGIFCVGFDDSYDLMGLVQVFYIL